MIRVAIVGGGPGGLITAFLLSRKGAGGCSATVFERDGRLGGKLQTRTFSAGPARYEAGIAECYDHRWAGADPLRGLVEELGLETRPTFGHTVMFGGRVVRGEDDLQRYWGRPTADAVRRFRQRAAAAARRPAAGGSGADLLAAVGDPVARRYLEVTLHSDLATEPERADARTVLGKALMDVPGHVGCYTIEGGMGRLAERLAERLRDTRVELGARVTRVRAAAGGRYEVRYRRRGNECQEPFDAVVVAVPVGQLGGIEWAGERLGRVMGSHLARHERRGHYLRVSLLFQRPFWEGSLAGSWFMVDDFGGACVYLESERLEAGGYGVLGFLLAGNDALALANLEDSALADRVIEALPADLAAAARRQLLEARVHRWCGLLSGVPGGAGSDGYARVRPGPGSHPGLVVVGDYLFESTLNGVYRSADLATDLILSRAARLAG